MPDTSTAPDGELARQEIPGALEVRGHRWTPNRIVAAGTAVLGVVVLVAGLAASLAVPAAVAAVLAGGALVAVPVREWLVGWREYEARQGEADQPVGWDDLVELVKRVADDPDEALAAIRRARGWRSPTG